MQKGKLYCAISDNHRNIPRLLNQNSVLFLLYLLPAINWSEFVITSSVSYCKKKTPHMVENVKFLLELNRRTTTWHSDEELTAHFYITFLYTHSLSYALFVIHIPFHHIKSTLKFIYFSSYVFLRSSSVLLLLLFWEYLPVCAFLSFHDRIHEVILWL